MRQRDKWCLPRDIELYETLRVKRFAFAEVSDRIYTVKPHGFCDSSESCYAAVVYLQVVTSVGVKMHFLAAKTKIAPLKKTSMPRLELLGCLLSSDLTAQIQNAFDTRYSLEKFRCWSDSQVVCCLLVCWIKGKTKVWKAWVENRVVMIRIVIDCEM